MKQTAVEYFFWKLYILKEVEYESIMQLYEQALEMEKEQIMEAYESAEKDCGKDFLHGDLYYHETFKSE